MNQDFLEKYNFIRGGSNVGFYEQKRGLIAVWGREAVQFLNGLVTNDVAKLEDGAQMSAAFPNAQGRLLALTRVRRQGEKFLFETESATRAKIFQNLFRFTFAGDFFAEDLSDDYRYFEMTNFKRGALDADFIGYKSDFGAGVFVPNNAAEDFVSRLKNENAVEISDELYDVLRIENGTPLYGIDADETTIVPELGDGAISYNKGCYIGQEIIARIHFRGHVAKQLCGLVFENENAPVNAGDELKSLEGKNAGKITSVTDSPTLGKIALAFVRYEFLAEETQLKVGEETTSVKNLPFTPEMG